MIWRSWAARLPMVPAVGEVLEAKFWREAAFIAPESHAEAAKDITHCGMRLAKRLLAFGRCPPLEELGEFDRAVVELTLGDGKYEQLSRTIDPTLARRVEEVAKHRALTLRRGGKRDLMLGRRDAIDALRDVVGEGKGCADIEALRDATRSLRALPTIEDDLPTVALVGMPNVGKSSLVRLLSTGKPQVNVYPFTTRGLLVGHFVGEGGATPTAGLGGGVDRRPAAWRAQVMDTPGLLWRPDHPLGPTHRNPIEALTMLLLNHLATDDEGSGASSPTTSSSSSIRSASADRDADPAASRAQRRRGGGGGAQQPLIALFVIDASEQCGFPLADQLALREQLRGDFTNLLASAQSESQNPAGHLWIDVVNKCDLGRWSSPGPAEAGVGFASAAVSAATGEGVAQLRALIELHGMRHSATAAQRDDFR